MLTNARNLQYTATGAIELLIDHSDFGTIHFSASPTDPEAYGRDLFARAVSGEFGPIAEYVPPVRTPDELIADIEKQRDAALNSGFTHNGYIYHCDPMFQAQVQGFVLAFTVGILSPMATVAIRRKDNITVQMTQAEVGSLAVALMAHVQGIYAASWAAKDALQ